MKKLFLIFAVVGLLSSCGGNTKKVDEEVKADVEEFGDIAKEMLGDAHSAKNSLDYMGTYTGKLPTASGEGMLLTLVLADSTYTKTVEYIGKKDAKIEEKGAYVWNEKGNTITLKGSEVPNQYFVGENALTQLDVEGNKIVGDLADQYILKK